MKKKSDEMLTRIDWDFNAVREGELFACCYWEYARESARIRAFCSQKDCDFFPAPEMQPEIRRPDGSVAMKARRSPVNLARMRFAEGLRIYALPLRLTLERVFETNADPLNNAWEKLPSSCRQEVVEELEPYFAKKPSMTYLP